MGSFQVSERRACRVLCVPRATSRYRSCLDPRIELRMRIREIAQARVRYGYRKIRVLLNREGWDVSKYLVYRLYTEEGLSLKRMKPAGKRKAARRREERLKATEADQAWSMDFGADQLQNGTRFRYLPLLEGSDISGPACRGRRDFSADHAQDSGGNSTSSSGVFVKDRADHRNHRGTGIGPISQHAEKTWLSRAQRPACFKFTLNICLTAYTIQSSSKAYSILVPVRERPVGGHGEGVRS